MPESTKAHRVNDASELAAILQTPVIKQCGVVEYVEKPMKGYNYKHEALKVYMRKNYPTASMRNDLIDGTNFRIKFVRPTYFNHPRVDKEINLNRARCYLEHMEHDKGFQRYLNRHKSYDDYKAVIKRMHVVLKLYISKLKTLFCRAEHVHFLQEIVFVKNLRSYPLPRRWIGLIAFTHNTEHKFDRVLAAIRVVIDYDGDFAPRFDDEMLREPAKTEC